MSNPAPQDSIPPTPPVVPDEAVSIGTPGAPLQPPTPLGGLTSLTASLQDSLTPSAAPLVPETERNLDESLEENVVGEKPERRRSLLTRPIFWFVVVAAIVAVALAVILPVYFTVIKPKNNTSTGGGNGGNGGGNGSGTPKPPGGLTTGGDGSTVTMDNGTEFTYHNPFGGFCAPISSF